MIKHAECRKRPQLILSKDKGPSDDDLLGRIRVPLQELIDKPDQQREDKLMSLKGNKASQGTLYWSTKYVVVL